MHAPQQEDPAPLRGHTVDQRLQPAQFVPRLDLPLGHGLVRAQHVEVGHEIQRHDGLAAQGVDQQVAGNGREVRAAGRDPADVVRLIVSSSASICAIGLVPGLALGALGATALGGLLAGVSPVDPLTLLGVSGVILGAALAASLVPSLRAAWQDPLIALRTE